MQANVAILKGIDQYKQPKPEGEIDLIVEVRTVMMSAGLGQKIEFYDTNRFIIEAVDKPADIQRYFLNRYWNQQLVMSPKISVEERYCLIPNGEHKDWLLLFKSKILPFLIENDLPVSI